MSAEAMSREELRREVERTLHATAAAVAELLDEIGTGPWSAGPIPNEEMRDHYVRLQAGEGVELSLWFGQPSGTREFRYVVRPIFPMENGNHYRPRVAPNEITVSATATAARLAQEINRRLLPLYKPAIEEGLRLRQQARDAHALMEELADVVAKEWGTTVHGDRERNVYLRAQGGSADARLYPHGGVKFSVSVETVDEARRLARFIADLAQESGE